MMRVIVQKERRRGTDGCVSLPDNGPYDDWPLGWCRVSGPATPRVTGQHPPLPRENIILPHAGPLSQIHSSVFHSFPRPSSDAPFSRLCKEGDTAPSEKHSILISLAL